MLRAVVQRVSESSCAVEGEVTGAIGRGLMVILGALAGIAPAIKAYATDVASNILPST